MIHQDQQPAQALVLAGYVQCVFTQHEVYFCAVKNKPLSIKFRMHPLSVLPKCTGIFELRLDGNISVLSCSRFPKYNSCWCNRCCYFNMVYCCLRQELKKIHNVHNKDKPRINNVFFKKTKLSRLNVPDIVSCFFTQSDL